MEVSFFSPIYVDSPSTLAPPPKERLGFLRCTTHFFNFGQDYYTITEIKGSEVLVKRSSSEKPSWIGILARIVGIMTLIIPAITLILMAIYRLSNTFKVIKNPEVDDCAICLEPLIKNVVTLPCDAGHKFHKECIELMFTKKKFNCPMDNQPLNPKNVIWGV